MPALPSRIVIIQGHPDPQDHHFAHALARAYESGAAVAGRDVRTIVVAHLAFPTLTCAADLQKTPPQSIREAQDAIGWANHLVIVFPLWLGTLPAVLKGFLEQVLRPGFATSRMEPGTRWKKGLTGRSARVIVTMGMPAPVFRWFYGADGVRVVERGILGLCGIRPVRRSLIGSVGRSASRRAQWLRTVHDLGRRGR